ncbi:MAG TPA: DUF4097 family beta strand repeat-containing protein [Candidatus Kapabacteria bacterium]|nr:DUF4097 family beta strand repeat-containing protein [Candidatus Kapabacteria bacterium]
MGKLKQLSLFLVLTLVIFLNGYTQEVQQVIKEGKKEISKSFKARGLVKLQTMSGNCDFKKGKAGEIIVQVIYDSSIGLFEPHMEDERGTNTLILRDRFQGGDEGNDALWIITVPEKTRIKSSSISGNFSVIGLNGEIAAKTVSGDILAKDCNGNLRFASVSGRIKAQNLKGTIQLKGISSDMNFVRLSGKMEVNTASGELKAAELEGDISCAVASGDIEIDKARGGFKVKTASGDIRVQGIEIQAPSEFKVTSGNVNVTLAESAERDLIVTSADGQAMLNYNGNPVKGRVEFRALSGKGEIISPFKFDKEEIEEKWGKKYDVKSFEKEGDTPRIYIHTSLGKAILKEK